MLSSDSTKCLNCGVANCITCIDANSCIKCELGFKLQNNNFCAKLNCNAITKCK